MKINSYTGQESRTSMRKYQKIQLINAPAPERFSKQPRYACFQPLDLISLASYLMQKKVNIEIEILDGQIMSQEEIEAKIDADIIGISPKMSNYQESLEIAHKGKRKGAEIIMGGAYASFLAQEILENRSCVDGIIIGDGEVPLFKYISRFKTEEIENFFYRDVKKMKYYNLLKFSQTNLNLYPIPRNDIINMGAYFERFSQTYYFTDCKKGAIISSQRGCMWREKTNGCIYCSRMYPKWRAKNPFTVWKEIEILVKDFGVDFIWDVSDTFTGNREWFEKFCELKPNNLNPKFLIYSRANELDEETVKRLCTINCYEVMVGCDSGDNTVLRKTNKGITIKDILKMAKLLKKYGINLFPCLVLGLPSETEKTAYKTLILAKILKEMEIVLELQCSILVPIPGSYAFASLIHNSSIHGKYLKRDIFDNEELRKDWVRYYCRVDYEYLKDTVKKILVLSSLKNEVV